MLPAFYQLLVKLHDVFGEIASKVGVLEEEACPLA
jgi:hypothetical protein